MTGDDVLQPPRDPADGTTRRGGAARVGCLVVVASGFAVVAMAVGVYALWAFGTGRAPAVVSSIEACRQPDTIAYEDGVSYAVFSVLTTSLSSSPAPAAALVSRSGDGSYGVRVELGPGNDSGELACRWEADRVEIVEPNGIVHVVPASVFTGGR